MLLDLTKALSFFACIVVVGGYRGAVSEFLVSRGSRPAGRTVHLQPHVAALLISAPSRRLAWRVGVLRRREPHPPPFRNPHHGSAQHFARYDHPCGSHHRTLAAGSRTVV